MRCAMLLMYLANRAVIEFYDESLFHRGYVQKRRSYETLVTSVSNYAVHGSSLGWLR